MENVTQETTCQFCGAPVRTEVCPYCGKLTGLNTATAALDYPEVDCKEAHLGFFSLAFPLIFAGAFGFFGFVFPLFFRMGGETDPMVNIICIPFAVIGVVSFAIALINVWRFITVSLFGKEIEGTVYGYVNDTVSYNDEPGQVCKIMVESAQGRRFIMYQLNGNKRPYKINSKLALKVYKNRFMIMNKHKYDLWEN